MRKVGRNDPCPCGSGRKFKQCCMRHAGAHAAAAGTGVEPTAHAIQTAIAHHQAGRLDQAEAIYRGVLQTDPRQPDALHLLGLVAHRTGRPELAIDLIEKAIGAQPSSPVPYNNLGTVFQSLGRFEEADGCFRKALALNPNYAEAHGNLANVLDAQGKADQAVASYRKALSLSPRFAEAHHNLANVVKRQGNVAEALAGYRRAVALKPDYAEAHSNLGLVFEETGRLDEALASYRAALQYGPDLVETHFNLANVLRKQGRQDDAVAEYRRTLALRPEYPEAHFNLAEVFRDQARLDEAVAGYREALSLRPDWLEAWGNLGLVLRRQGKVEDASAAFRQALDRSPDNAQMHYALALALQDMGSWDEAASHYRRAAEASPDFADAYCNLGYVLQRQGRLDEAIAHYRRAIACKPDFAEAYSNLGHPLQLQGRIDEAVASYRQSLAMAPDNAAAHSNLLLTLHYAQCSAADRFAEHLRFGERFEAPLRASWPRHANSREPSRRLRIGYVSGDFRDHAVAYFIEPIIAHHDRAAFEVSCYYNHTQRDTVSDRIAAAADHWIPCAEQSDDMLTQRIRDDGIDILVDLSGHTAYNRLLTFARKAAPVQVTWIGYPSTTGLSAMDYRLTEECLDPVGMTERFHTETLLRLPAGATFRPAEASPPVNELPALASPDFTLACLNGLVKLNRQVVGLWARILAALPHAKLLLGNVTEPGTRLRVLEMFAVAGVSDHRLVILPRMALGDYLEMHSHIDLALDPFPYNGGTTSCHSLWMGVPMVTLAGSDTASRYGVALLRGVGLPEFVAASEDEYVARVVELAQDLPRLNHVRQTLRGRVTANLSRDPAHLTRNLEQAYRTVWQRWCDGSVD